MPLPTNHLPSHVRAIDAREHYAPDNEGADFDNMSGSVLTFRDALHLIVMAFRPDRDV